MKRQIILVLLLLVIVGCYRGKVDTVVLKPSTDNFVGVTSTGDTVTIEDIENTIDSLNKILYDE